MFKRVRDRLKDWVSRKIGDKDLIEQRDFWYKEALGFETKALTYSDAMIALNEKHLGTHQALVQIISATVLREPNQKLSVPKDMLIAAQQCPEIQLVHDEEGNLTIHFNDEKFDLEVENEN